MNDRDHCLQDKKDGEVAALEAVHVELEQVLKIKINARFLWGEEAGGWGEKPQSEFYYQLNALHR